jgi:hypothetical protein
LLLSQIECGDYLGLLEVALYSMISAANVSAMLPAWAASLLTAVTSMMSESWASVSIRSEFLSIAAAPGHDHVSATA